MYTLLVGKSPLDTKDQQKTYERIERVDYEIDERYIPPVRVQPETYYCGSATQLITDYSPENFAN